MKRILLPYFSLLILLLLGYNELNATNGQSSFDCGAVYQIPQEECEALVAIYNNTDGDNWAIHDEWLMHAFPCEWAGVTCEYGHVDSLVLSNLSGIRSPRGFGLSGAIPAEIGDLSRLRYLDLTENLSLTSIPPEIGMLDNLTMLVLYQTSISELPPEIGLLDNLSYLDLNGSSSLKTIPPQIGLLDNLRILDLRYTALENVPPEIGDLNKLNELYMGSNIKTIPPEIGNLNSLKELWVSGVYQSVPPEIGNLYNLVSLSLWGDYQSVPAEIGNLINLKTLELHNNLTSLPSTIGNLTNLETFEVSGNKLTSLPPEIGNLTKLPTLDLSDNQLVSLPSEIGNLSNLTELDVRNNRVSSLPSALGNLTGLGSLYMSNNELTSLPSEISTLDGLFRLKVDHNQLQNLPQEIGELDILEHLDLSFNQLSNLPPEIGLLSKLYEINLRFNQLNGNYPAELVNLSNLRYVYIDHNPLVGILPQELINLGLRGFNFDGTDLCEPTNAEFQAWLSEILYLRSTGFTCMFETITPSGGILLSADSGASFTFPENTFTETVTVTYRPLAATLPEIVYPLALVQGYELTAESISTGQPAYPIGTFTTTIYYPDQIPIKEETINLYYWDGGQWVPEPSASVDMDTNMITAMPDYFAVWAVLGESKKLYFPTVFMTWN